MSLEIPFTGEIFIARLTECFIRVRFLMTTKAGSEFVADPTNITHKRFMVFQNPSMPR